MAVYQVTVRPDPSTKAETGDSYQIRLPRRCPCCAGDISPDAFLLVGNVEPQGTLHSLKFPCCSKCAKHVDQYENLQRRFWRLSSATREWVILMAVLLVIGAGLLISFVILFILLSRGLYGLAIAGMLLLGLGVYMVLEQRAYEEAEAKARKSMSDDCCATLRPVRLLHVSGRGQGYGADFTVDPDGVAIPRVGPRAYLFEFKNHTYAEAFAAANGVALQEVKSDVKSDASAETSK